MHLQTVMRRINGMDATGTRPERGRSAPPRRSRRGILLTALVAVQALSPWTAGAPVARAQDSPWKNRFLNEVPKAADDYLARSRRLQGRVSEAIFDRNGALEASSTYEFKQDGDSRLLLIQQNGKDLAKGAARGDLRALNADYGFELSRKNSGSPWVLSSLVQTQSSGAAHLRRSLDRYFDMSLTRPVTLAALHGDMRVRLHGDTPGFSVIAVTPSLQIDRETVRLQFSYETRLDDARLGLTGSLILDPHRSWIITDYDALYWSVLANQRREARIKGLIEYRNTSDGFPIVHRITSFNTKLPEKADSYRDKRVWEYELRETSADTGEFRLSAFGLPEPAGSESPREPRWYLWIIGGAALVGMMFWAVRRRTQPPRN